jgi:FkbM family methyltransferase
MRHGFILGVIRRFAIVPRLMLKVKGWPALFADAAGFQRKPYSLRTKGVCCEIRPGSSDWWIFLEMFVFEIYRSVDRDISQARTIVDIGANVGFFAIHASTINPAVETHMFEPFPANVSQIQKNLSLNRNVRGRSYPVAVSDHNGFEKLFFSRGDESGCSLVEKKSDALQVEAVSFPDLFKRFNIEHCDLLKMDCEGSELPILRAATPEHLANIRAVILEFHNEDEVAELVAILSRVGFKCEILQRIKTLYACRG